VAPGDRSLLRRVTTLFRPYRVAVYGVGVLILLSSGLGVVSPLLIRVVFDRGLFARGGPDLSLALVLYGAMIAVPVLVSLLGVWQSYLTNRVGQDVMRDLRSELFSHLQRLSLRFVTGARTGDFQSRLRDVALQRGKRACTRGSDAVLDL